MRIISPATHPAQNRTARNASLSLRLVAAVVFLIAGGAKLAGAAPMVEAFEQIGAGQWFRVITGIVEIVGGLALLRKATAGLGGLLLTATMTGALLTHLFVIGGNPALALALLLIVATITWLHRASLALAVKRLLPA